MGNKCRYDELLKRKSQRMKIRDYSLVGSESKTVHEKGLVNAKWYQSPISAEIMNELVVRRNKPAVIDTAIWLGLILISGLMVYLWWGHWFVVFPYMIYSVLYASTSDSRWHESSHGTAFKTDWMNNALYELSSFMVVRQSTAWKWSHARHHSDTIIRGRDPEISVKTPPDVKALILTFFGYAALFEYKKMFRNAIGKIDDETLQFVPNSEKQKIIDTARIYLLIYFGVILLSILTSSWLPLMYIGLPTLFGSWLMPIYGYTQHAGLQENILDHRLNCRTVYMNRVNRFLYWNMNYHVEHHMFPLVPYYNLPKLHEQIKQDCPTPYAGIIDTFKEIIPTIKQQLKDPEFYVKRQLPTSARPSVTKQFWIGSEETIKDGWIKVCSIDDLQLNSVRRFDFKENTFAIYRTSNNTFYASSGLCTHGNSHLSEGLIVDNQIECAKHNGRFCLNDGAACRNPVKKAIQIYTVELQDGFVMLKL